MREAAGIRDVAQGACSDRDSRTGLGDRVCDAPCTGLQVELKPAPWCLILEAGILSHPRTRILTTMSDDVADNHPGGVYGMHSLGVEHLVHEFTGEDYGLDDIHVLFGLGSLESTDEWISLTLSGSEIRQLKVMADAQSFDHPEDFIAMCLDIHRFAAGADGATFRFRADF